MAKLEDRLAALGTMSPTLLRAEWLRVMKTPIPPAMTLDLIRRAIGYRLQEQAEGGLPPALRRSLERLGAGLDRTTPIPVAHVRIKPGTRLVRDWGGTSHHVVVDNAGFVYREQRYRSLSEIACTITGAKWSGPRFFGLRSAARG